MVLALLHKYRSIKAELFDMEETNEDPFWSKRLTFTLQSNLKYKYETNKFSSWPINSISLNCNLDL